VSALDFEDLINQNIKGLPLPILKEILDFTLFLKEKRINDSYISDLKHDLKTLNNNELNHLEKEFENYKELYPYDNE
jgi:hypothetical protein